MKSSRLLVSLCFVFLLAGVCRAQFFTLPGDFGYALNSINQVFDVSPGGRIAVTLRNDPNLTHSAFLTTFDPLTGTQFDSKSFGFGPLGVQLAEVGDSLRVVVLTSQGGPRAVTLFDVAADGKLTQLASTQLTTSGTDSGSNIVLSGKAGAGFALVVAGSGREMVTFSLTDGSIISRLAVPPPHLFGRDTLEMVETPDKRMLAFLGDLSTLRLVDATNPASPAPAGAVALPRNSELSGVFTPGIAFTADARYVFVGNNFIDFSAVDVAAQQVVGTIGGNFRFGRVRIFEDGQKKLLALLSTMSATGVGQPVVLLVDATDPSQLSVVNQFGGAFSYKTDMAFSQAGGRLYVAAEAGLSALNVPSLTKAWEQPVSPPSLRVHQVKVFGQPEEVLGAWDVFDGNRFTSLFGSFPALPPDVTVSDASAAEGSAAGFSVALSAPTTHRVVVNYATADGTAASPSDYTDTSASVIFEPGETLKTVSVQSVNDKADEFDETFKLNLTKAGVGVVTRAQGTATLFDNDPPPAITLNDLNTGEGDSGAKTVSVEVLLSETSGKPVTVNYATAGGTATAGLDYAAASGELAFSPGETRKLIAIGVNGDTAAEADETVVVNLSSPVNATLARAQGALVILNDEARVQFDVASATVTEGIDRSVTLNVTRVADLSTATTVSYETLRGTAFDRSDYTAAFGTLRFAPNESSRGITISITDDAYMEGSETFTVRLFGVTGGAVGTPGSAAVRIESDDAANGPSPVREQSFDTRFFVRQHYLDFLGREPDQGGMNFWSNGIESCGPDQQCLLNKRIDTSAAFFLSIEFQETGFLVHRMYKAAYGEADGFAVINDIPRQISVPVVRLVEFLPDSQRIAQDVIVGTAGWPERLAANKAAFALEFVQRPRFTTAFAGLTPEQFVDRLITNAGITMEAGERQALIDELTADNTPAGRASVLRKVAEDSELADIETNKAFVLMQYFGYLRRNPDASPDADHSGYNFWLTKLNQFGGDFRQAQMVLAFIDSIEYKQRFGNP